MKILVVSTFYPPANISGASRGVKEVSEKLAEKGIGVELVTLPEKKGKKEIQKSENFENLTIHRIPFMDILYEEDPIKKANQIIKYLEKIIKKNKIDLISSQALHLWSKVSPVEYSLATTLVSINRKIPNILRIRAPLINEIDKAPVKNLLWDKIICVSNAISEEVHNLGVDVNKIATLHSGTDTKKFRPRLGGKWLRSRIDAKEDDLIVLFAGRLTEAKGVPPLLNAFSMCSSNYKNIKLLLAVPKSREEFLEEFNNRIKNTLEKAKLLGIENKVIIKSFELDEMPLVYNGSDIFVLPSQYEGSPQVVKEAMACNLPVIGTSVGGIPEIITNGKEGYLIPVDNPTELSKRIEWLIKDPAKRKLMGVKGRKKVREKFDLDKLTEKLIGIFKSSIHKTNGKKQLKQKQENEFNNKGNFYMLF